MTANDDEEYEQNAYSSSQGHQELDLIQNRPEEARSNSIEQDE